MARHEETEYLASAIGILSGADIDFDVAPEEPCLYCKTPVNLDTPVSFIFIDEATQHQEMKMIPERDARQLLAQCGLEPPPVLCVSCGERYGDSHAGDETHSTHSVERGS